MTRQARRRWLYALGIACLVASAACAFQWFGLAFTAGDALAAQESVHPYTAKQMAEWNEMARQAGPWFYAAMFALVASLAFFLLGRRLERPNS